MRSRKEGTGQYGLQVPLVSWFLLFLWPSPFRRRRLSCMFTMAALRRRLEFLHHVKRERQRWRTTGWLNAEPYGVPPISWMESVPHDEATDLFGMSWVPAGSKRATAGQDDLEGLVSLYKQSKSSYVAVKLHTKTYQGSQALPHSSRLFVCARSLEVC